MIGLAASLASYTQFAIVLRAVVRSTARFACAKSPFEPTTWIMRSGDMFRRSSASRNQLPSSGMRGNERLTFEPDFDVVEAVGVRDIVHQDSSECTTIVERS